MTKADLVEQVAEAIGPGIFPMVPIIELLWPISAASYLRLRFPP